MTRPVLLLIFCMLVLLCGLVVTSLALGDISLSWHEVLATLTENSGTEPQNEMIVLDLRLPRVLLALLVGMALAVAGTIAQGITRNPLAEPGILGINSGAALAAMIVIVTLNNPPITLLPWAGFAGAIIMATVIYLLSWRNGTSSLRIVLIGIGLASLSGAVTTFLTAFGEIGDVQRAMIWLAGSVYEANHDKVQILALWLIIPVTLAWLSSRELDVLRFGDNAARALGQKINLVRALMILLCTLISGAAVASSGLIGFVGLIAPHMARRLVGPSHVNVFPVAALIGAVLVAVADLVGRMIIAPAQIPAGIVTALIGAPFFAYLLWGQRHGRA